ncbi:acyl carrier protein [Enterococcus rivorum]|uniref:Acyl carrier protein n=1 Tax=Enterococcus rivorum TaxID=762845 RepID=A0A1E5KU08_9ENTE|nr:acyl carrier protein [Enterococcus rivorum]MBP2100678.1 acyl carrier protein [Enterococcus rivorum]OEH81351.1 acyl carrier protein [Enterococcus rivorum]
MVFEKIQAIIVEELGKEADEVQLTTNIQEELDADSLDLFQIINEIEDAFDVKIESEDGINTVQDLVTYVEKQQAEK